MLAFVDFDDFYVGCVPNNLGNSTISIAFYNNKTSDLVDSIPNYRTWEKTQSSPRTTDSWLYSFRENLYYKDIYCDTLYYINDFSLHPRYIFNTGGLAVPYKMQNGGRYDFDALINNSDDFDLWGRNM